MTKTPPDDLDQMKRIMGVLGRMPPKPHSEMKIGKPRGKPNKSPKAEKKAPPKQG
jgi:hypothetical protein